MEKLITNYNNETKSSSGDQHIVLAKVDVDKFEQLSSKFKVKAVPTGKIFFLITIFCKNPMEMKGCIM